MAKTVRMTTAQAIVKFLDNQYVSMDGVETKFVEGFFTIFGHGIAVGLGEALDTNPASVGPPEQPTSPARASMANIAVPPLRIVADALLNVPGHIMPTEKPHTAHPISPTAG